MAQRASADRGPGNGARSGPFVRAAHNEGSTRTLQGCGSGRDAGRSTMYDVRTRLDQDLKAAVSRLRQLGGAAQAEERSGTIGDTCPFADEVDWIQVSERRELGFATRELVLERVNR